MGFQYPWMILYATHVTLIFVFSKRLKIYASKYGCGPALEELKCRKTSC